MSKQDMIAATVCIYFSQDWVANLDSNRDAPPHASVHIPRAAATQQHTKLYLLELTLLQAGELTIVLHQVLPRFCVPDLTWEGAVGRCSLVYCPAVTRPHHTRSSRLRPRVCLHIASELSQEATDTKGMLDSHF